MNFPIACLIGTFLSYLATLIMLVMLRNTLARNKAYRDEITALKTDLEERGHAILKMNASYNALHDRYFTVKAMAFSNNMRQAEITKTQKDMEAP